MFTRIVSSALFAGVAAGLIAGLLQLVFVQPVLLHAELYEGGDLVHFGAAAVSARPDLAGFDPVRDGLSLVFTVLVYCAYGLMLLAAMAFASERGASITPRAGIVWGIAGFLAFHLAPAFSLPPEVPGVAAADMGARQIWWIATAIMALGGLALIAFGARPAAWAGAAVLLLAPHLYGAPEVDAFTGPVPPEIAAQFASRTLGVGMASWAILGLCAAWFWEREGRGASLRATPA